MNRTPYYVKRLKEELSLKQRGNPQYSLRAFARDLDVHPGTMGQIIKGLRPLPFKDAPNVVTKLRLGPKDRTLFMESLLRKKTNIDLIKISEEERFMLDESYYKVIAEWEHYAVLDLYDLDEFRPTLHEICSRLGIMENRAEVVVNNLLTAGLLKLQDGKLQRVHSSIRTTEDIRSQALRDSHVETMKMGIYKIDEIDVELRDFSATTVALDLEKLPEAKTIIREFRQKMEGLLRDGKKTEVYQLAIQFYPLTQTKNEKS